MRYIIAVLVLIALSLAGLFVYRSISGNFPGMDTRASYEDMLLVDTPLPNSEVSSPLTITGKARGGWYFEASFPVTLYDANKKILAQTPAQAQSDWMTKEYVPFTVTLTYIPTTETGVLELHNDNPSGLPENDRKLEIPVRFAKSSVTENPPPSQPENGTHVKLYYYNPSQDQGPGGAQCSTKGLVAVERVIPKTTTPLTDAIKLLLRGELSDTERSQGLTTEFPLAGVSLKSAAIVNDTATLTFLDSQNKTSGGSCRVTILRAEIERTAKQFSTVKSVKILPTEAFQP